ncbi:uncharacterized protein LOC126740409 isoform X2 [Anthonomus grandis grandis]|uniref:uncharacterized protein LOC126740409 isoform X2 n=1 Tax=Anthonomus grandis grandis TaxID=2921223 RepID=UPI002165C03F|nr:uncharacterized protein LOC126740409 isoform X2 [Anthonomus grandis grandis]
MVKFELNNDKEQSKSLMIHGGEPTSAADDMDQLKKKLNSPLKALDESKLDSTHGYSLHSEIDLDASYEEKIIKDIIGSMRKALKSNSFSSKSSPNKKLNGHSTSSDSEVKDINIKRKKKKKKDEELQFNSSFCHSDSSSSGIWKLKKEKRKLEFKESSDEKSPHKAKKKKAHIELSDNSSKLGVFSPTFMNETVSIEDIKEESTKSIKSYACELNESKENSSEEKTSQKLKKEKKRKAHIAEVIEEESKLGIFSSTFMDETISDLSSIDFKVSSHSLKSLACSLNGSKESSNEEKSSQKLKKKKKMHVAELNEKENSKLDIFTPNTLSDDSSIDIKEVSKRSRKKYKKLSPSDKKLDLLSPDFEVPPLHKLLNRVSKPNPEQRALIQLNQIATKSGKYLKHEDQQILENWQHFIQVNDLPNDATRFYSLDKRFIHATDKQKFLYYLARNMPERTPYSVYQRFKCLVMNTKQGKFSQEEDAYILKKLTKKNKKKNWGAVKIANKLNRSVKSIHKRIEILQNQHTRKIKFKGQNAATFIKYLIKVTGIPKYDVGQLKDRTITAEQWAKLSRKLDGIPVRVLQKAWLCKLYPALFIPDDVDDMADVKFKLIQVLSQSNETEWKSISWAKFVPHFEGFTGLRLYILMNQLVKKYVAPHRRHSLKKCLKTLLKVKREEMPSKPIEKISYENGTVSQRGVILVKEEDD